MTRPIAAVAALMSAFLAVVACGGEDPAELARESCKTYPPGNGIPDTFSSPLTLEETIRAWDEASVAANEASDLAAQAAAADRRWEALATADSDRAAFTTQMQPVTESLAAGSLTDAQRQQGQEILPKYEITLATIRAQCRIADASK